MNYHSLLRTVLGAAALVGGASLTVSRVRAQSTTTYNFSILAGGGAVLDHTDGSGTSARFFNPTAAAVDASGNIYIADAGDHTVRKVSGNSVSTLAGTSGQPGSTGNHLVYPAAVAVDAGGNVFVADMGDDTIRKITPGGSMSIIAGIPGQAGSTDGAGAAAKFNGPQGVAVDGAGNVYVADTNNSTIRKISPTGAVSTFAGIAGIVGSADGSGGGATFNFPSGLAVDTSGNLFVADYDNSIIRKITAAGAVSTIAGAAGATGAVNGTAGAARFDHPNAVGVDAAGNVYVLDTSNQLVRMISAGSVTTLAGTANVIGHADGSGVSASFFYPLGLAASAGGTVYVADTGNHSIRTIAPGGSVSTLAGQAGAVGIANGGGSSATFRFPYGAALDGSGSLYIADSGNNAVRKITSNGTVSTLAGGSLGLTGVPVSGFADGSGAAATFNNPSALAVDGAGSVYVADTGNSTIRKVTAAGVVSTYAGSAGSQGSSDGPVAGARFNRPQGIAIDGQGNLYVADTGNNSIRKITVATGQVTTFAGGFNGPTSVAVDTVGNVYVSDFGNDTIRRVDSGGNVATLAGSPRVAGDADGTGGAAAFNQPYQIAVDAGGNVFVADTFNRAIRIVNTSGQVYTVNGSQSRFLYPQGIAIDRSSGNLYVVDGDNQTVSVGIPVVVVAPQNGQIASHSAAVGGSTAFTYGTAAPGTTFQWQVSTNGGSTFTNVLGATSSTLNLSGVTAAMNGYQYRVVLNNVSATSAGTLYVGTARLINLSSRANVAPGSPVTAGIYVGGSGTKNVLVRGIGPTLGSFGVGNALADPSLTVNAAGSAALIGTNTVWGGGPALANAMSSVGAFSLAATSADSALLTSLPINGNTGYTATVSSVSGGSGNVLAEIYDMDVSGTPAARLINISTLAHVDSGANILTSGFVITGAGKETLLIRGDGPSLSQFGVTGVLASPLLTLFDSKSNAIVSNTGWGSANAIATAASQVGAFGLTPGSTDAAIIVSLDPGTYTVQVSGNGGASGMTMLEVYEVK